MLPSSPLTDTTPIKVLYIEDDERLAKLTTTFLESRELQVTQARTSAEAMAEAASRPFDVVLIDVMLPGIDGIELCRWFRRRFDVPILMISALREEADKVIGLESGADDYLTKPFSPVELVSRIRANVRRARGLIGPVSRILRVGPLALDPASLRATLDGRDLELTSYEFALLRALAERPGQVHSREQLLDLAKGTGAEDTIDRTVDVHISRLRAKLGDDARQPRLLKTVRRYGYMLALRGDS